MIQLRTEVPVSTPTPAVPATATAIPAPAPLAHATSAATTITSFLIFSERKTWPRRWMITSSQFMNSNKTKIFSNSLCLVMHLCLKTLGSPHGPPRSKVHWQTLRQSRVNPAPTPRQPQVNSASTQRQPRDKITPSVQG